MTTKTGAGASESKLINQGTYGCIYYPSLPFQIHRNKRNKNRQLSASSIADEERSKYVSKLQKHNFHSEFEDYIGKKIQEIPSFELFFVPILKTHKIDLATIKQSYVTECNAIKDIRRNFQKTGERGRREPPSRVSDDEYDKLNKTFIVQKMRYINGIYLHSYIMDIGSPAQGEARPPTDTNDTSDDDTSDDRESYISKTLKKYKHQVKKYRTQFKHDEQDGTSFHLMSIVFDLYERVMDSIQILIKYRIVHYDLKENNILIENTQQLPYIIDFGLSIDVTRLMEHPWSDKQEESSKTGTAGTGTGTAAGSFINSEVLYRSNSSKIFQHNYLWRQHFYVHAPDYFLWPIEVHIITYLIHEHDTLTDDSLGKICYDYVLNNKAFAYMSGEFKKKMFRLSVATFSRFIHQPRETVINELLKYWDKWDMYAINIMFLKIVYEMVFHKHKVEQDSATATATETATDTHSRNEHRQQILDPKYSSDASIIFKNRYKIKLKQKYNNQKIMNTIQVMLRNIHPNPDKRMTPQETKAFFVSIFYEC